MKRLQNWLARQWDKIDAGAMRVLINPGNWQVTYPDGNKTFWMDYKSAKNLCACFGGKLLHRNQSPAQSSADE